jgi:hypothetical protein
MRAAIRTVIHLVLWNIGFAGAFAALVASLGSGSGDTLGVMLPAIAATWLLFLAGLYANSRGWVIGCAGLLYTMQVLVSVFLVWFSRGFGGRGSHTGMFEFQLVVTVIAGTAMVWWFLRSKLPPHAKQITPESTRGRTTPTR